MMKSNWGNWIAFAYTAFVLLIIFMVYMTFGEKWDLVSENYYEQEIKYQEKIDQRSQAIADEIRPQFSIDGKQLLLSIPLENDSIEKKISGQINFFRPSDASKDFTIDFNKERIAVALEQFSKGKYTAKVSWNIEGVDYYNEQTLIIP